MKSLFKEEHRPIVFIIGILVLVLVTVVLDFPDYVVGQIFPQNCGNEGEVVQVKARIIDEGWTADGGNLGSSRMDYFVLDKCSYVVIYKRDRQPQDRACITNANSNLTSSTTGFNITPSIWDWVEFESSWASEISDAYISSQDVIHSIAIEGIYLDDIRFFILPSSIRINGVEYESERIERPFECSD